MKVVIPGPAVLPGSVGLSTEPPRGPADDDPPADADIVAWVEQALLADLRERFDGEPGSTATRAAIMNRVRVVLHGLCERGIIEPPGAYIASMEPALVPTPAGMVFALNPSRAVPVPRRLLFEVPDE